MSNFLVSLPSTVDTNLIMSLATYQVTFQVQDYRLGVLLEMGGNCRGFAVMEAILDMYADELFAAQGESPCLTLWRQTEGGDREPLVVACDEEREIVDWLKRMCVAIVLVNRKPDVYVRHREVVTPRD